MDEKGNVTLDQRKSSGTGRSAYPTYKVMQHVPTMQDNACTPGFPWLPPSFWAGFDAPDYALALLGAKKAGRSHQVNQPGGPHS